MSDPYGSFDPGLRTRPLTWAVVVCVVVYNAYLLISSVHSELWGWIIPILMVWLSIPAAAVYAFKRLHLFMTGDRDRQHPVGDQVTRALLIGGFIHLAGVAMRYEPPKVAEEQDQNTTVPYKVPSEAPQGSVASLAEYVERCSLTQGELGLVMQTSDGGLHLMDLRSGVLVSPPTEGAHSYESLASGAPWSVPEVIHMPKESLVVHARDAQRQMDLAALGLQYIGPAVEPDHFIAFHRASSQFQRLNVTTGDVVWRLPFERTGQVLLPQKELRLMNLTHSWNLMTFEAFDRRLRYLILIDDPALLIASGLEASEAGRPQLVFLDPVMPAIGTQPQERIRELIQVPGTASFLMKVEDRDADVHYVRFRLQSLGGALGLVSESFVPHGHELIRQSFDGPGPTLGLQGREIALEAGGGTTWQPLQPKRHNPPISGFSVALERDVLLPSPVEGRLELLRAGQGYLPWVAEFPGRSFSRDRHCVAQSTRGNLVAIALGSELRVLFKAGSGGVDTVRQWGIDLPIDAKAALNGAARR